MKCWLVAVVGMFALACSDDFSRADTDAGAEGGVDAGIEASVDAEEPDVVQEAQCAPMDDPDACLTLIDSWCRRMHECCSAGGFGTEACSTHTGGWHEWDDAQQVCRDSWKSDVCYYMEGQVCSDDVWACDTTFREIPCFDIMHRTFVIPGECLMMMP